MRRVENMLQTAATITKEVEEQHIKDIASKADLNEIREILNLAAVGKNFVEARKRLLYVMVSEGLSGLDILPEIQRSIWDLEGVDEGKKIEMIKSCAEIEFRIVEGSDEFLQMEALLAGFAGR